MAAARIDLHTHSTASDGTASPEELVQAARAAHLDVLALTDHDTTDGWARAEECLPPGLRLVRGAEISCRHEGISLHLLAYLFDPDDPALAQALAELRTARVTRAERMVRAIEADGLGVTWQQVQQLAGGTVGRPHVAQALIAAGHVASVDEAFGPEWIGTDGRYWVPKHELDVFTALRLVAGAGGVTVFAHPFAVQRGRVVDADAVVALAEAGLTGLEVDHVDHDDDARRRLRRLADRLGLVVTGSSDFHGTNKEIPLGAHTTAPREYERLVERATGVAVVAA